MSLTRPDISKNGLEIWEAARLFIKIGQKHITISNRSAKSKYTLFGLTVSEM
jgi:hypothetical protein